MLLNSQDDRPKEYKKEEKSEIFYFILQLNNKDTLTRVKVSFWKEETWWSLVKEDYLFMTRFSYLNNKPM